MANPPSSGSPVQKLILLVLVLILFCLGAILVKLGERPELPNETAAPVQIATAAPEAAPPAQPISPAPVRITNPPPRATAVVTRVATSVPPSTEEALPVQTQPILAPTPVPAATMPAAESAIGTAWTPAPLRYEALPDGSEMRMDGESSVHKWSCISKIIAGYFLVEPAWQKDLTLKSVTSLGPGKTPPMCKIKVPVRTLKSQVTGGSIMDSRMQSELKARIYPTIDYELDEMTIKGKVPPSGTPVTFETKGRLLVCGVTNKVTFPVTMERLRADELLFSGSTKLKMSDLGIKPPRFSVLGVNMTTGDSITLTWKWHLGLSTEKMAGR